MKSAKAAIQKEPKTRRTREEGMQLLFDAAQKLLATNDPDDISIRDIAAAADTDEDREHMETA